MTVKFAVLTLINHFLKLTIHIQMDKVALSYLVKMKGTHSLELLKISKPIWQYLMSHGIIITAEYLRNVRDLSDWKLRQSIFQSIVKHFGYPSVELFSCRLCDEPPQYVAWKPDPNSLATNAIQQQCWNKMFFICFSLFSLISRILKKIRQENVEQIIVTPTWQTQPWYPLLLEM